MSSVPFAEILDGDTFFDEQDRCWTKVPTDGLGENASRPYMGNNQRRAFLPNEKVYRQRSHLPCSETPPFITQAPRSARR